MSSSRNITFASVVIAALTFIALRPAVAQTSYVYTTFDITGANTYILGVNNLGEFVGYYTVGSGPAQGFVENNGTFTTVNFTGSSQSYVTGINDSGTLAGYYDPTRGGTDGFYGQVGSLTSFTAAGASETIVHGINNSGEIVGEAVSRTGLIFAFYDTPPAASTTITDPKTGTSKKGVVDEDDGAYSLNNLGQIVGYYNNSSAQNFGYVYSGGTFSDVSTGPGVLDSLASGINDGGQIVGYYDLSNTGDVYSYLDTAGVFSNILYPGATDTYATDINNAGVIVGSYDNGDGVEQGFIATPVPATPEPGTITTFGLAGLGLVGLILRKRKLLGNTSN